MSTQPTNEEIAREFVREALMDISDTGALAVSEKLWDDYSMPDDEADERLGDILGEVTRLVDELRKNLS